MESRQELTTAVVEKTIEVIAEMGEKYSEQSDEFRALDWAMLAIGYIVSTGGYRGFRAYVEGLDQPLTPEKLRHLQSLGIEPFDEEP